GTGAYAREDHLSHRFVADEIASLKMSSRSIPPIFLAVAAFLLYIVIARMVQAERTQIGLLKAFGYTNLEVSTHYLKFVLCIAILGAVTGCALGIASGRALASFYQLYYKFPFLVFAIDPGSFVSGVSVSVVAASAGGVLVLRQVFALTPANAMRPPSPPDFSRSLSLGKRINARLDQPSRMVIRNLLRQPGRSLAAVIGISAGMALSVAMLSVLHAFDDMLDNNFTVIDRSDVTVTFIEPMSEKTLFELGRLQGVLAVEPFRVVPALLQHGRYSYRGAITALAPNAELYRAVDERFSTIELRDDGLILSRSLAELLHLSPGDTLSVSLREGRRPTLELPVAGLADTLLGSPAYFTLEALGRALKEPGRASGAYLRIDSAHSERLYRQLRDMPAVAGVSLRSESRAAFAQMMESGAGAMRYIMAAIAAIITFGIVYNSARIAYAERSHDLASLRVIGLTRSETSFVLLGELGIITLLALPLGVLAGYYLNQLVSLAFSTDLYRIPSVFVPASVGTAMLAVLGAALGSGWLVLRDLNRLDLVWALKTRE
ncbi:MAG TPA: FtsX-like permease family protein, partial [Marinobacter sp.]|nr:FtsX-like permease family protein [Marinobacter sp.]